MQIIKQLDIPRDRGKKKGGKDRKVSSPLFF
jgi:hypothetical protein